MSTNLYEVFNTWINMSLIILWNSYDFHPIMHIISQTHKWSCRISKNTSLSLSLSLSPKEKMPSLYIICYQTIDGLEEIISSIWLCMFPFDTRTPPDGNIILRSTWSAAKSSWFPFQSVTWSKGSRLFEIIYYISKILV